MKTAQFLMQERGCAVETKDEPNFCLTLRDCLADGEIQINATCPKEQMHAEWESITSAWQDSLQVMFLLSNFPDMGLLRVNVQMCAET